MNNRKCGDCKACCYSFNIAEISLKKGQLCPHIKNNIGSVGCCSIFGDQLRPSVCSGFECLYLQGLFGRSERPDKTGILAYFSELENGQICVVAQELKRNKFKTSKGKNMLDALRTIRQTMEYKTNAPVYLVKHHFNSKKDVDRK